jgi:anti-sigma factor RsiW
MNPTIAKGAFSFNRKGVKVIRPIDDLISKAKELGVSPYGFSNKDGYKLDGVNLREMRGKKVLILNYSQNESRVTMFLLKPEADLAEIQKSSRRQQGFYAWKESGASIILIGDASQDELQNLAKRVSILGR